MSNSPIKVYDARWETGDFTSIEIENLFLSSCAYAQKLDINTVVISRDARLECPDVVEIAVQTARKAGFDVYLCQDPISTPQSYYNTLCVTQNEPGTMGWTITASHNPASYIGVKFVIAPVRAIGMESGPLGGLTEIQKIYSGNNSIDSFRKKQEGKLRLINFTDYYIKDSMNWAGVAEGELQGMKVILNPMNGSAGTEVYRTLESAGVKVRALNLIVNGNFPDGAPNPISKGRMNKSIELSKKQKNSIVIGLDGDGDRIVFGDENGLFSAGTAMMAILTCLKSTDKSTLGRALCDPKVDPPSLDFWRRIGYEPILFRNGHSQIKDYMLSQDIAVAAEESGHYYHKIKKGNITAYCENSLLTILLFLKSIYEEPELLSLMRINERKVYTTGEINYKFPSDNKRDEAISLSVSLLSDDNAIISKTTIDGIDLQGIAFMKGINRIANRIEEEDWYSGFYRIATNEKSIARFYLSSGTEKRLILLSEQIRNICEKDLCGIRVE